MAGSGTFLADLLAYPFLRLAVGAGLLASIACGFVGSYVTVRRIGYIAGAIAHSVLAGMGAARYVAVTTGLHWISPVQGAAVVAVIAALIVGAVSLRGRERVDTALGAIWAVGMAVGVLFVQATPGYAQELMSYLFGNILLVSERDLLVIAVLDVLILSVSLLYYNRLLAVAFDEEFARIRGLATGRVYVLSLVVVALAIVILAQVVGILLVIALLTLPAATAAALTRRLAHMIALAVALSALYTVGGLAASYGRNLPAGATIVLLAGCAYLATAAVAAVRQGLHRRRASTAPAGRGR